MCRRADLNFRNQPASNSPFLRGQKIPNVLLTIQTSMKQTVIEITHWLAEDFEIAIRVSQFVTSTQQGAHSGTIEQGHTMLTRDFCGPILSDAIIPFPVDCPAIKILGRARSC